MVHIRTLINLVFEEIDKIMVMQQHCGGENIIVYKENLKTGGFYFIFSRLLILFLIF